MDKIKKRTRRQRRIRAKVIGTTKRPRVSIFRSLKNISAQIINDEKGVTLVSFSSSKLKKDMEKKNKTEKAQAVGEELAILAKKKKITSVVFDRGGYRYHGRVKALADGLRRGGLKV